MFIKTTVLFFAFFALVNAAPILIDVDLGLGEGPANPWKPIYGVGLVQFPPSSTPSVTPPSAKRGTPLEIDPDSGLKVHAHGLRESAMVNHVNPFPINLGAGVSINLPRDKREVVGLIPNVAHIFDDTTPKENGEISFHGRIGVAASVEARDIVIDSQTLAQLESFVNAIVNALKATGNTRVVNTFLTQINNLKVEVENGTLDVADLLSAARVIVLSII